jgi:large subunit ribosomal protein L29
MTKATELREMSDDQLTLTMKEAVEGLFKMRLKAQTEQNNASSELKKQRRLVARVKTIQTQRATAAPSATAAQGAAANTK